MNPSPRTPPLLGRLSLILTMVFKVELHSHWLCFPLFVESFHLWHFTCGICVCVCVHVWVCVCACFMLACLCVCECMFMHACVCVCVCLSVCLSVSVCSSHPPTPHACTLPFSSFCSFFSPSFDCHVKVFVRMTKILTLFITNSISTICSLLDSCLWLHRFCGQSSTAWTIASCRTSP